MIIVKVNITRPMGETIINLLRAVDGREKLNRMQLEYPFPLEVLGEIEKELWDQVYERFIWEVEIEEGSNWFRDRNGLLEKLIENIIKDEKSGYK